MSPVVKVKKEEYDMRIAVGYPDSLNGKVASKLGKGFKREKGTWMCKRHLFLVSS